MLGVCLVADVMCRGDDKTPFTLYHLHELNGTNYHGTCISRGVFTSHELWLANYPAQFAVSLQPISTNCEVGRCDVTRVCVRDPSTLHPPDEQHCHTRTCYYEQETLADLDTPNLIA